jgi:hypothetical protein
MKRVCPLACPFYVGAELPSGASERALRAAAICASDMVVEAAGGSFNAHELGCYLLQSLSDEASPAMGMLHVTKCKAY